MKCFTSCFQPSKYNRLQKSRNKTALKELIDETYEHSEKDMQEKEVQPLEVLIDLIADSKDECEKQLNSSSRKKVTFNLNVQVQAYETLEAPEESLLKNEDEALEERDVEEDAFSDSSFITYQPNHRLNNFRSGNEECEDIKLEGSDLANDANGGESDENDNDNGNGVGDQKGCQQEESYDSLFSISLDSKKHTFVSELGDKEVNSPFKKSVHNVVLTDVEGLIPLKAIKTKANPLPLVNRTGKENVKMEKQLCNQSNAKENEVAVDASLSSWLVESEKTRESKKDTDSSACNSSDSIKSSNRAKDRPILGEIYIEEMKQVSNCSSPRGSQGCGRNETPKIGTVGSYWKHTGQATSYSTSDSSCKGPLIPSSKCRDQGEVKCSSIPFQMRLERAVETVKGAQVQPAYPPLTV